MKSLRRLVASPEVMACNSTTSLPATDTATSRDRVVNRSGRVHSREDIDRCRQIHLKTRRVCPYRPHCPQREAMDQPFPSLDNAAQNSFGSSSSQCFWIGNFLAISTYACSKATRLRAGTQMIKNSGLFSFTQYANLRATWVLPTPPSQQSQLCGSFGGIVHL